ncbi:LL-diaminopimelate aminotransferase [Clostridium sp. AF18-27]|uniref:LL-diaminopimelate aminotransferase n=1 Tax=Enterocloster lavalensis TaxID=460384 RepID=UPI000E4ECFBF|nr:LL-diaminopimelate aminotransferase [Enterocloster lavalensis]MBS5603424.1 LL-diaminopimelate aminotransferase [Enterocloster asparagiformis]RHR48815.1 LL-diaminopimelate aminotransferase [Clostridium sp. AF18-27]
MLTINENYLKLPGSYLFSDIAKKVAAYQKAHPEREIIRLGIGDVTQPIAPAIVEALHRAVDEMGDAGTFRGYAPDLGYDFLREAIVENDYRAWGCAVEADEIFVSDGAKSDCGNIQEIFGPDCRIAVCDPVYPVYVDSNVMAGRAGTYDPATGKWSRVIYMPCTAENGFVPELPKERPDLIYLCVPNNPTGTALTRDQLAVWVNYANENGAVILYDAAYEAYITEQDVPHSIYEISGARTCAVEFRSFSKKAGFTGLRLGFTVVPKDLTCGGTALHGLWARRHGTKFNGAPYIVQRAGEAVYSAEGKRQVEAQVACYMENARVILQGLKEADCTVFGGVNSPYIWLKTPEGMTSWQFFDFLLENANVVGTPGSGFGPSGEGYFRLTAFGTAENTARAMERMRKVLGRPKSFS